MSKNWTLCPVIGNHSIPLNRHHLNTGLVCYSSFCCIWGPTYSFVHRHAMLVRQIFFSPFYYFNFYETNLHPQMSNVLLLFWVKIRPSWGLIKTWTLIFKMIFSHKRLLLSECGARYGTPGPDSIQVICQDGKTYINVMVLASLMPWLKDDLLYQHMN